MLGIVSNGDLVDSSGSLDEQRRAFSNRRFLAMPLAGAIAWAGVGITGYFCPPYPTAFVLFGATGSIAYLGMFLSRFTGEHFLDRSKPKNEFDSLFFHTVAMAFLVYGIAIPFFLLDYTSLPLTVGILSGLMWVPLSWLIKHWVGIFHGVTRTVAIVAGWYFYPTRRFVVVPLLIVLLYLITIAILEARWRRLAHDA
jgi:hypothetical protein